MKKIIAAALVAVIAACGWLVVGCTAIGEKLTKFFMPMILLLAGGCLSL